MPQVHLSSLRASGLRHRLYTMLSLGQSFELSWLKLTNPVKMVLFIAGNNATLANPWGPRGLAALTTMMISAITVTDASQVGLWQGLRRLKIKEILLGIFNASQTTHSP